MKRLVHPILLAFASLLAAPYAFAQVAGTTTIGVEVTTLLFVASGWSAKKQILGKRGSRRSPLSDVGRLRTFDS